jgi:exoribonuclease R
MELVISDRNYTKNSYTWVGDQDIPNLDPAKEKMIHGDKVIDGTISLCSKFRNEHIPALLLYSGSTFGRHKDKLIYMCVPYNKSLPIFLVPFGEKTVGLSKSKVDYFVTIKYKSWNDKHPTATIQNTLGRVNDMDAYIEYQLICNNIGHPIQKFTKSVFTSSRKVTLKNIDLINDILNKFPSIEDRTKERIISIDPAGCLDIDDAMSYTNDKISVYIANVAIWMEYLDLWEAFAERVSTIYLPDRMRPMLPPMLSEGLCSLIPATRKIALAMDMNMDGEVTGFAIVLIENKIAYAYESKLLNSDNTYQEIKKKIEGWNKIKPLIDEPELDSHTVVQYLMLKMNAEVGNTYPDIGLMFRSFKGKDVIANIPSCIKGFIRGWESGGGSYTFESSRGHDAVTSYKNYSHVTSPIRRIVDLYNCILITQACGITLSKATHFLDRWGRKICFINSQMKAIKKVQNDVAALHYCLDNYGTNKEHTGYVIQVEKKDQLYSTLVHLPEPKLLLRCIRDEEPTMFEAGRYSLYMFNDETTLRRKVRLNFIQITNKPE